MEQTIPQKEQMSTNKKVLLIGGLILLIGWMVVVGLNMIDFESIDLQGREAPNFALTIFDQFEQDEIILTDRQGQPVVLNFWASWCVECYREAALLEQAWQDYEDKGVLFVGVDHLDTDKEALAYIEQYGITYPNGPDIGGIIADDYGITGVPETIFIDGNGNITHVQIGPIEQPQLYRLLDQLIAVPAQAPQEN